MHTVKKPWWQQATALVTVSAGGVITGFNFVPGAAATMTTPTSVPLHLLALEQAAQPGALGDAAVGGDSAGRVTSNTQLRAAIVNVAGYYLQLAKTKTTAQMDALIWGETSSNGADHGPSCAAFASLTLELAAQTVGLQSWVTGGTTYPWPMPAWADVRVDTNPASPAIMSMVADAQAHGRWHPVGDGYAPQPGDWAVYNGHVAVVTSYSGGVLDTIAADSLPNLTVNAHSSAAPLAEQGVTGFIDNGNLKPAAGSLGADAAATEQTDHQGSTQPSGPAPSTPAPAGASAAIPGLPAAAALAGTGGIPGAGPTTGNGDARTPAAAVVPGVLGTGQLLGGELPASRAATPKAAAPSTPAAKPTNVKPAPAAKPSPPAAQPSTPAAKPSTPAKSAAPSPSPSASGSSAKQYTTPGTRAQQAFISTVAPGAMAAQQRYGVPASVTIAQAIEESAWGQSSLAAQYHNLFGIKGTGPAGSVTLPTQEYEGGQWVTIDAQFAVYHNDAESITDHAELLATSGYYTRAMADRNVPDAFANDLTGVYATDPNYGANLIALMKLYNLYQYDTAPASTPAPAATPTPAPSASPTAAATPAATPTPAPTATPAAAAPAASATLPSSKTGQAGAGAGDEGSGSATVPGVSAPALAPSAPSATTTPASTGASAAVGGQIPGLVSPAPVTVSPAAPTHVAPAQRPATKKAAVGGSTAGSGGSSPAGSARIPGLAAFGSGSGTGPAASPAPAQAAPAARQGATQAAAVVTAAYVAPARAATGHAATGHVTVGHVNTGRTDTGRTGTGPVTSGRAPTGAAWYETPLPQTVATALFANAKGPLARGEHLYRDVAACTGGSWKLLAAVDWMQCKADPRYSPVQGEKLGSRNEDGTSYSTKSAALTQCACDLIELSSAVYGIDLTAPRPLNVRELAAAFAAFRWGAILKRHGVSPMEFPYSVAGLTAQHQKMHWPSIAAPDAPDRPGARFREAFGAVPVVLSLGYPATV